MAIHIDPKKCIGCEACKDACPYDAITIVEDIAVITGHCSGCASCITACPQEAISITRTSAKQEGFDKDEWKDVWVVAEYRNGEPAGVSFELLTKGRELADTLGVKLAAVVLADKELDADRLIHAGADKVYVLTRDELGFLSPEPHSHALQYLIETYKPEIVLAGATAFGRTVMPLLAASLETGLTADCTGLDIHSEKKLLLQTRPTFGGNLMATIVCPERRPQMATVRPHVFAAGEPDVDRNGEVVNVDYTEPLDSPVRVLERVSEEEADAGIEDADIIVAGGRGLASQDGFDHVRRLAKVVGGAVGATRPVVDEGRISYAHQIGQTGKTVCPKLYIACGISGAVQHLAGMQTSEVIVAINKDADAPIFAVSDICLTGDVNEIVPLLAKRLEEELG